MTSSSDWCDDVGDLTPLVGPPPGCDTGFFEAVRGWLVLQPVGTNVVWGQHHAHVAPDVHTSWVDVLVPAAQAVTSTSWLVTIDAPDVSAQDANLTDPVETVVVPFDIGVRGRWDTSSMWWDLDSIEVLDTPPTADPEGDLAVSPAWSTEALCRGLKRWAHLVAGRGDIIWVYDAEMTSPAAERAADALDAYLDGSDPGVDLGGALHATSPAFDFLAEDPDRAAEILAELRDRLGEDHKG